MSAIAESRTVASGSREPVWPVFAGFAVLFLSLEALHRLRDRAILPAPGSGPIDRLPRLLLFGTAGALAAALVAWVLTRPPRRRRLGLVAGRLAGQQVFAIVAGVVALGFGVDALQTLLRLPEPPLMRDFLEGVSRAEGFLLLAALVVVGLVTSTCEELFFRGTMQRRLTGAWGPVASVLVTSLLFAAMHGSWTRIVMAFPFGLFLGYLFERTGTLYASMTAHAVNNTLATLLPSLESPRDVATNVALLAFSGFVLFGCIVWIERASPAAVLPRVRES